MCINMQPATTIYTIQLAITIPQPQYSLTHLSYVPLSAPFSRSPLHGPYTGEIWGHTHSYPPHTHTLLHQLESIQTGTVLSPVPTSLVEKIESSAFIKMGDLIPTHLGLDDTVRSKLRCSITNITEWLQAFTVYVYLSNCQDTTSSHFRPHGIPDSDSRSQQRISSVFSWKAFQMVFGYDIMWVTYNQLGRIWQVQQLIQTWWTCTFMKCHLGGCPARIIHQPAQTYVSADSW